MVDDFKDLLSKIDIPFFNNNLEYINLWITFYQNTKDIGILFLMKYKKISSDYYWLYFELANFYKKKGKEGISVYILQKAIENKVYKNEILIEVLKNYEGIEPVTENYAHKYLYPKGFKALGRVWNEFINVNYCKEGILKNGNEYISLEEYRFLKGKWVIKIKEGYLKGEGWLKREQGCLQKEGWLKEGCIKTKEDRIKTEEDCIKTEENCMIEDCIKDDENVSKEINLIQFIKSLNCSPKEQALILEFCLLQILIFISENKESPKAIDFENLTLNQNFEINFNKNGLNEPPTSPHSTLSPTSPHSQLYSTLPLTSPPPTSPTSLPPFSNLFIFFDQFSMLKILSKDLLQSFEDLNDKIYKLKFKFSLKENIFIINKFKILLIEKFHF